MSLIKTGIASYGMSGKLFHAPFIQAHPGYELTAIVERHKEESREKYPDSILYKSFEELIANDSIQLIVVNTPVQLHYEHVTAALQAGKHVIAEKPFTITEKEAASLAALAQKNNLLLSVYQNRRYDGDYRAVKQVIDSKSLGELKEVEIRYDRYRPAASGKLHKEGNLAGAGTLHDLGAHLIDQALQLFGIPEALFADVRTLRDGLESNDYFEILLYYPGLRVRLKSTVLARESYYAYILQGTKGTYLQQRSDRQEEELLAGSIPSLESWCTPLTAPDGLLHTEINGEEIKKTTTSSPGNYMGYYDDLYKALIKEAGNPVPASDAVLTMWLIDTALTSSALQKVITL